jgi:hypothetical protein
MRLWTVAICLFAMTMPACAQMGTGQHLPTAAGTSLERNGSGVRLFVIDLYGESDYGPIAMFDYLTGQRIGNVSQGPSGFGVPMAGCVDKAGDVYVAEGSNLVEYSHDGAYEGTLIMPDYGDARNCSVDSSSGDVAVTNAIPYGYGDELLVFRNGKGTPEKLQAADFWRMLWLTYDGSGNIFVDGFGESFGPTKYGRIKSGSQVIQTLQLDKPIKLKELQFDGKNVVAQASNSVLYRIHGTNVIGKTVLSGSMQAFSVFNGQLVVWHEVKPRHEVMIDMYRYPDGGKRVRTIVLDDHKFYGVEAVVVSK